MNFIELGEKIRSARLRAGLSQTALARPLGMSRVTVSEVENGTFSDLGVRKLARLCQQLGLKLEVAERRRPTLDEAYEAKRTHVRDALRQMESGKKGTPR